MIHIKQDGTGDFTSVQAALDSLPADNQEPVTLFIHKGIYREQIHVTVPYVSFPRCTVRHRIYAVAGTVLPERLQGQSAG